MTSFRRILLASAGALALSAALLLAAGCKAKAAPRSAPQPFTATLTEIDGVQAIYTFRHPAIIAEDLKKPTADIPEAAMLQMFLGQLAPYGYPSFSEITPGSNIGVVMLKLDPGAIKARKPEVVAFARLKEGGKIQTALEGSGIVFQKHGDWMWIARDPEVFAKVKNADAITAYIDRPQTEDLRAWGRVSPDLLDRAKAFLLPKIQAKLSSRRPDEQKALVSYFDVIWGYLAQLHSFNGSLSIGDKGIELTESAQFLPDSALGTLFRYTPPAYSKITQSVPVGDNLVSFVARENVDAETDFLAGVFDSLITVDYPPVADLLKNAKANCLAYAALGDGTNAGTMTFSDWGKNNQPPKTSLFVVSTGHYTQQQVLAYNKACQDLSEKAVNALFASFSTLTPNSFTSDFHSAITENALTIDGINFASVGATAKLTARGKETTQTTTNYFGVVGGNTILATDEAALRANLPALVSGQPVADPVQAAAVLPSADELAVVQIHGGKIVDIAVEAAKLDASDPDIKDQIKSIKDGYAQSGPVTVKFTGAQAKAGATLFIPYKFIEQSIHLGQFVSTYKHAEAALPAPASPSTNAAPDEDSAPAMNK